MCLRHGNGSVVEGNFFFGNNKPGTGGIRLYGNEWCVKSVFFVVGVIFIITNDPDHDSTVMRWQKRATHLAFGKVGHPRVRTPGLRCFVGIPPRWR